MSELMHWHGTPSEFVEPPKCCTIHFERHLQKTVTDAVHDERRRIILDAISAVTSYANAAASVLPDADATLVKKVTSHAVGALRTVGCICPRIDITTFGGRQTTIPGRDHRCGIHDPRPSTKEHEG